jgi:hypothetical protein
MFLVWRYKFQKKKNEIKKTIWIFYLETDNL